MLLLVGPIAEDWGRSRLTNHMFASRFVGTNHQESERCNWNGMKLKFWKIDFHEIRGHTLHPFLHTTHFDIIHSTTSPQKEFPWFAVLRISLHIFYVYFLQYTSLYSLPVFWPSFDTTFGWQWWTRDKIYQRLVNIGQRGIKQYTDIGKSQVLFWSHTAHLSAASVYHTPSFLSSNISPLISRNLLTSAMNMMTITRASLATRHQTERPKT